MKTPRVSVGKIIYMTKTKIFSLLFLFITAVSLGGSLLMLSPVYADDIDDQLQAAGGQTGLSKTDPRSTVSLIIRAALGILATIFIGLTVYAGFLWMTAGGNEESVDKAKKLLFQAVIGLAIVLCSYAITLFAFKIVRGQADSTFYRDEGTGINFKF